MAREFDAESNRLVDKVTKRYTISRHRHVFAAWAASTAARADKNCRFSVADGRKLLEAVGFGSTIAHPNHLPPLNKLDDTHRAWRTSIIRRGNWCTYGKNVQWYCQFTHGIAAKLINVYVKAAFTCGPYYEHPRVAMFHPPIDRLLLEKLKKEDKNVERKQVWKEAVRPGGSPWTTWDSKTYERAIQSIRNYVDEQKAGRPLWTIEKLWIGHQ